MITQKYTKQFLVSEEVIEDWEAFDRIVKAMMRQELAKMFLEIDAEIENETINGIGDVKPTGFIKLDELKG